VPSGHAIGSFQAVSHRAADGATELTAASLLIPEAASALAPHTETTDVDRIHRQRH
jgi:alkylation response protein AidB-like acyl-CoA dehydrogenase